MSLVESDSSGSLQQPFDENEISELEEEALKLIRSVAGINHSLHRH